MDIKCLTHWRHRSKVWTKVGKLPDGGSMSTHRTRRARAAALLATATTVAATLAACGSDDDGGGGSSAKSISVWIEEDLPERVQATQAIADEFTKKTGIKVKLTAAGEDRLNKIPPPTRPAG